MREGITTISSFNFVIFILGRWEYDSDYEDMVLRSVLQSKYVESRIFSRAAYAYTPRECFGVFRQCFPLFILPLLSPHPFYIYCIFFLFFFFLLNLASAKNSPGVLVMRDII
jgi:hypothetical protein